MVAEENIFLERTITVDVGYQNLEASMIPSAKMPTVNISIRGDQSYINSLKASDFDVVVDFENASFGENEYEVIVSSPAGVSVESISPNKIYLNLEEKAEKQVPLRVNISGSTEEGFSNFEPSLKTSHVTISGPKTMIDEIQFAEVDVTLDNANSNLSLKLLPRIKTGNSIVDEELITINPGLIDVFVPVIEDNPSKSVPVIVPVTGIPSYGYKVSRIVIEPEIVRISGANEIIEEIREIRTKTIDISNASDDISQEVELDIPEDIQSVYEDQIKVVILFERNIVEKRVEKVLEIRNAPGNLNLKADQEKISIVLRGEELDFREFLLETLEVYVDASTYSSKNKEFEILTKRPANIDVLEINPEKVTLSEIE